MSFELQKLSLKIVEKYGTRKRFADKMGISYMSVIRKLNGDKYWKQTEIAKCSQLLGIDTKDIGVYFFKQKVNKTETFK